MKTNEIIQLFERIKMHYNMFTYNDEKVKEWHKFLKDYSGEDVNRRLDEYLTYEYDSPPLCMSLIKNIEKQNVGKTSWVTCCDICKERITIYDDDMEEYEKHHRRCSKIDFIDRMVYKYNKQHIASVKYYQMSDEELEENYQKTLAYYRKHRGDNKNIIKSIESIDIL